MTDQNAKSHEGKVEELSSAVQDDSNIDEQANAAIKNVLSSLVHEHDHDADLDMDSGPDLDGDDFVDVPSADQVDGQANDSDDVVEMMGGVDQVEPPPRIPDPDKNEISHADFMIAGYKMSDLLNQRESEMRAQVLADERARAANDKEAAAAIAEANMLHKSEQDQQHQRQMELEQKRQDALREIPTSAAIITALAAAPVIGLKELAKAAKKGGSALTDQVQEYRYNRSMREFQGAMKEADQQVGQIQTNVDSLTHGVADQDERKRLIDEFFAQKEQSLQAEGLMNTLEKAARTAQTAMERGVRAGLDPDAITGGTVAAMAKFQRNNKALLDDISMGNRSMFDQLSDTIKGVFGFARDLLARLTGQHQHNEMRDQDNGASTRASHGPRMG